MLGRSELDMHEKRYLLIERIQSVYRPEDIKVVAKQHVLIAINGNVSYQSTYERTHEAHSDSQSVYCSRLG